jgi:hypothetical protein
MNLSAFVSHVATAYQFNYLEAERSKLVTPFAESYQAVVWHCLVSHPLLQKIDTKW